ncbi:MAG: methyl-accepting chemotaxis protein [Elusimicrobia bacterium]|nr:methyl-accepting chemotaxis protein [Elusimicrobiota bacterium]
MGTDHEANEEQRFQRKTVLVKRALQLKYIGVVFLSVLVASMIVGGDVYYSLMRVMLTECPSVTDRIAQFNTVLLVKIALYLGLMLLISLYVSHRFAGPIYRFEKSCQSVGSGDLTHRVSLRIGDELMELQEEFNGMAAALQVLLQKDRNLARRLSERVEEIAKRLPAEAGNVREDLKALKVELDHLTRSFKV